MLSSDKYCICGIISDSKDFESGQPRKRLAICKPNKSTTHGIDIPFSTKHNPGQLKQAACLVLGISMDMIYVSNNLKLTLQGK